MCERRGGERQKRREERKEEKKREKKRRREKERERERNMSDITGLQNEIFNNSRFNNREKYHTSTVNQKILNYLFIQLTTSRYAKELRIELSHPLSPG